MLQFLALMQYIVQKKNLCVRAKVVKNLSILDSASRASFCFVHYGKKTLCLSLVPRPVRAIRVTRGGLEQSAIARIFPTSLTGDVTSEIAKNDWERGWLCLAFEVADTQTSALVNRVHFLINSSSQLSPLYQAQDFWAWVHKCIPGEEKTFSVTTLLKSCRVFFLEDTKIVKVRKTVLAGWSGTNRRQLVQHIVKEIHSTFYSMEHMY